MLEARSAGLPEARGTDDTAPQPGTAASVGVERSVLMLWQQASSQLAELEAALAIGRRGTRRVTPRLAELARTIVLIGAAARRLEREVVDMRHAAYHDALTGLPNRALLLDRLDRALAQAVRHGSQMALLMLDLDAFKLVNDRLGHFVGDQLLRDVAQRLRAATRDADTICRYGGDEFVVLLSEVAGKPGALDVARKIRSSLASPFFIGGHPIAVSACVGIAVYPQDGSAPHVLLEHADEAMYELKTDPSRSAVAADNGRTSCALSDEISSQVAPARVRSTYARYPCSKHPPDILGLQDGR